MVDINHNTSNNRIYSNRLMACNDIRLLPYILRYTMYNDEIIEEICEDCDGLGYIETTGLSGRPDDIITKTCHCMIEDEYEEDQTDDQDQ